MISVRRLTPLDAIDYRAVRLHGLLNDPAAFAGCYHVENALTVADFADRIPEASEPSVILGAFQADQLVGIVGLAVPTIEKLQHNGVLWGMYTMPTVRGLGVGRLLMNALLAYARDHTALEQIRLAVTASNTVAKTWYEKIGFTLYAVEPRAVKFGGRYEDDELRVFNLTGN